VKVSDGVYLFPSLAFAEVNPIVYYGIPSCSSFASTSSSSSMFSNKSQKLEKVLLSSAFFDILNPFRLRKSSITFDFPDGLPVEKDTKPDYC
jgi:hypothetical protein